MLLVQDFEALGGSKKSFKALRLFRLAMLEDGKFPFGFLLGI